MDKHRLRDEIRRRQADLPTQSGLLLGFSGGMDSTVLLHVLANEPSIRACGLRALHVDHGLHSDSAAWAQRCRETASLLDVAIDIVRVTVAMGATGLEDAARQARHAAFAEHLAPGEILVLAQHRNDQAETILLKLLRGAGPEGLGGMRVLRPYAKGLLWRPLLNLQRSALHDYAATHALRWIQDPSNADDSLRRNFLRHEILPHLQQRWPDADAAIAHSARWARTAADFVNDQALQAFAGVQGVDPATLRWRAWLDLPAALRDPVLRMWLRACRMKEPAHTHVDELERQLREAGNDRSPCLRWPGVELRRYRDLLYAMQPLMCLPREWQHNWDGQPLLMPDGGRLTLEFVDATHGDAPALSAAHPVQLRYRRGGERLKPAGHAHTRELRLLLQEVGLPPWRRDRTPLLFVQGELIAVADLFLSERGVELFRSMGAQLQWLPTASRTIDSAGQLR